MAAKKTAKVLNPVTKKWRETKFRKTRNPGECLVKGCDLKSVTPRAKLCEVHKRELRALQLKANNATWHKRVKAGTAGHYSSYNGKVTKSAKAARAAKRKAA